MNALFLTSGGLLAARVVSAWLATGNKVAALWTGDQSDGLRPDRALGLAAPSWSIASLMRRHNIPVRRNPDLKNWADGEAEIARLGADVLITAATPQIVPEKIIGLFPGRAVNFHCAALPHYRGPHPVVGMILDGEAERYGGVALHCLTRRIDEGDIIAFRKLPHDQARGYLHWEVSLARAAGELAGTELQDYLKGRRGTRPQAKGAGNYRKVNREEMTLSAKQSASHVKWLCDQLGDSGWIRFRSARGKKLIVPLFLRLVGPATGEGEKIGRFTIEFDAADAWPASCTPSGEPHAGASPRLPFEARAIRRRELARSPQRWRNSGPKP